MNKLILGAFLFHVALTGLIGRVWADDTVKKPKSMPLYLVHGVVTPVTDALIDSIKGEEVYKCQVMETKISKSGTSISLKAKKKAKE